jgi:O-antigen/teichoic acid export membrane protein
VGARLSYLLVVEGPSSINRDRALTSAVSTGLLSKGGAVALQLLAIPFAIRQLGLDAFGQYAAAIALFSWAGIVEGLVGQSVIRKLVPAVQRRDADAVSSIAFTAATVMVGATLAVMGAVVFVFVTLSFFSERGLPDWDYSLVVAAALVAVLRVMLAISSKVRAAFQQLHIENSLTAASNLMAAILVFAVLSYQPSPIALLLSMAVPALLAQFLSALLLRTYSPLLQGSLRFDRETARELTAEGGWISLGQIGLLMERQLPIVLFSVWGLVELSGLYAVSVQIMLMAASPLLMFTMPFMPAVADAIAAGQHKWWRRRLALIHNVTIIAGLLGIVLATTFGPQLLSLVFRQGEFLSRGTCAALAAWIAVILASNGYYAVMCAAGKMRLLGLSMLLGGICFVVLGLGAFLLFGLTGVFWCGTATAVCCMYFPWRISCNKLR